jgi:hypothetical protein
MATLDALIDQFRRDARDLVEPYLCDTKDVVAWLNEAETEACIRARLLFDDVTAEICEIAVVAADRELPTDPRITEIVDARLIDAGGASFPLELVTHEWMLKQYPLWREQEAGLPVRIIHNNGRVTFDRPTEFGYTLEITVYRTPLVAIGERVSVTFQDTGDTVTHVAHGHPSGEAVLFSEVNLTTGITAWTTYYLRDVGLDTYSLCAAPGGAALPLTTNGTGEAIYLDNASEIDALHHRHLVNWALFRAFGIPDSDVFDPKKEANSYQMFEQHFGPHPGSDLRKRMNARQPRQKIAWC